MGGIQPAAVSGVLAERHILVVEDQALLADLAQDILLDAGAGSVMVALNIAQALKHLDGPQLPDIAMIDLNLNDEGGGNPVFGSQLAEDLIRRGIPFIFATGYGLSAAMPESLRGIPVLPKPYTSDMLVDLLRQTLAAHARA